MPRSSATALDFSSTICLRALDDQLVGLLAGPGRELLAERLDLLLVPLGELGRLARGAGERLLLLGQHPLGLGAFLPGGVDGLVDGLGPARRAS